MISYVIQCTQVLFPSYSSQWYLKWQILAFLTASQLLSQQTSAFQADTILPTLVTCWWSANPFICSSVCTSAVRSNFKPSSSWISWETETSYFFHLAIFSTRQLFPFLPHNSSQLWETDFFALPQIDCKALAQMRLGVMSSFRLWKNCWSIVLLC